MTGIYIITNAINGKRYIGQSVDIQRRFMDHRCVSHETNRHLRYALQKYGKAAFRYEILEECTPESLDERERFWIAELHPEYNVTDGGQGRGKRLSEDAIGILRQRGRESWEKKTEAEKAKVKRENLVGPKRGHPVSERTRTILREKAVGVKQSAETIEKRKATFAAKKANGYVQTNAGHKKPIVCVETGATFESVKQAAEWLGVHPSNITSVLKGRQATAKGFRFSYLEV